MFATGVFMKMEFIGKNVTVQRMVAIVHIMSNLIFIQLDYVYWLHFLHQPFISLDS